MIRIIITPFQVQVQNRSTVKDLQRLQSEASADTQLLICPVLRSGTLSELHCGRRGHTQKPRRDEFWLDKVSVTVIFCVLILCVFSTTECLLL